ncbi:MAG: hypothetical protein ISR84_06075 [Kiritimatiellales bacterium]|nr:hypothetical protein [Kiritimatiellales bacterium]
MMKHSMKRMGWTSLVVFAVGLSVLLSAANLFLGDLNQDEGWYLYAARQITEGRVLYRDFMFTQGPALPYVYGVLFPIIGKLGVAGGRLITSLFGLASVGCAAWLAFRSAKRFQKTAALCALILAGVNVYQSYFTTIVKTYGLCAFFLTAGFVALSYANGKRGAMAAFWGGFLLALAACARFSAGIALPIAGVWLICNRKKVFPLSWVAFGLGGGFILLIGLVPFFLMAPENTHFALFGYHAGRSPGGVMELAALKAGFVSRFVQAYFIFAAGCVVAFLFRKYQRHVREAGLADWDVRPRLTELLQQANQKESPFTHSFISLLWMTGLAISLVHFAAPFPYDDYQVIVYPVLCAALAATLIPRCPEKYLVRTAWAVLLICAAASFSSPINQSWMVRGRDRIWWTFKETPDLIALQRVGAQIREQLGEGGLLLTQDTYLAVEAGARVPHGMEMGPFSYYPDLPREQAEQLNLLNKEMLLETLSRARAPMAAISGYGLTIESPSIGKISSNDWNELRSVLEMNYTRCREVPNFGQAHTTLELFERIPNPESRIP